MTGATAAGTGPAAPGDGEARAGDGADAATPYPRSFWPAVAVGWALMAVGLLGILGRLDHFAGAVPWARVATWVVGAALVHDLVVAPVACAAGLLVARLVPRSYRAVVGAALVATALLVAVAWPGVRGYGRLPTDPSVQPNDYASGLATVLALVWGAAAVTAVVAGRRRRAGR